MQLHDLGDDGFHSSIVSDKLHRLIDHQIFQPLFVDGFLLAAFLLFGSRTFIIAVDFSRPACAAFAKHQSTAAATVQLGCQQVIILCLSPGRGFLVFGDLFLHIVEQFQRHDGRNRIRYDHIPEFQFSDVPPIFEHMFDTVIGKRATDRVLDAIFVQPIPNLPHGLTIVIPLKRFRYERRSQWVDLKTAVCVDGVSKGDCTTGEFALESIFCHATNDFFRQVSGIILSITFQHRFQNDALRPLGDDLGGRHELDTILLQLGLVPSTVVAVPSKTI